MTKLHPIMDASLQYGMNYWDTATNYSGTKSQLGIGQYLEKHPKMRKKLFLVSKPVDLETPLPDVADFDKDLRESMERTKTDYFDGYCAVHGLSNPNQLTDELKKWAESCKKRGLFKYLGYSAHNNMAQGLFAAAKCGWIDFVLVAYNFQLMQDDCTSSNNSDTRPDFLSDGFHIQNRTSGISYACFPLRCGNRI